VNHRKFAFDLGGGLPGQSYLESRAPLEAVLRRREHPWLLKRPLGFAGRGQLRVYDHERVSEKEWQWIDASLREDGLLVEPLVEPSLEVSAHGFVFQAGHHELGRVCVQEVTERGVFRGVRLAVPGELAPHELDALHGRLGRVAEALRDAGYFGPFGIDGYRYRQGARSGFVALSEINARYTMGFVTGFPRHPSCIRIDECPPPPGEA
jgi:phosphoribosylaminoimidazole carboxylase (NCAIR synthetase)